jgi:hypothetical protein
MRNWHHRIIKLNEALALIPNNNIRVVIGVCEGIIECDFINPPQGGLGYRAVNRGLFRILNNGIQKVSIIDSNGVNVISNVNSLSKSSHATSVAGIIGGTEADVNNAALPIRGIIQDAELMSINHESGNPLKQIFAVIDNFRYFMNPGSRIIDSNFQLNPASIFVHNNDNYIPPNKQATAINLSVSIPIGIANNLKASINLLHKTVKAYSNNGRGVLFVISAGNNDSDVNVYQGYGKHFTYPLIVSAVSIDSNKDFNKVTEFRSGYSCYGNRVDICGPSNPKATQGKNQIYSTTMVGCGEVGYDNEVIVKNITSQASNSSLTLSDTNQMFPGNCLEIGVPGSIEHEVLIIKKINRTTNVVDFIEPRFYTASPFNIQPATVRIPVIRNQLTLVGLTRNRFTVTDNRGLGYIDQEIFISNNDVNGAQHHLAKISAVIAGNDFEYEFNPALPAGFVTANVNMVVTPGQVILTAGTLNLPSNGDTEVVFSASDDPMLNSLFTGEMVAVIDTSSSPDTFLFVRNISFVNTVGTRSVTLEKTELTGPTSVKLASVGYGSYTSSFGGTSAASPVVCGVAGLVYRANPDLNALEIKHILKSTADKIVLREGNNTGKWKDAAGNNISYSSVGVTLAQATVLGSNEIFVNNPAAFSINDAVEIDSAFRSVVERVLANRLVLQLGVTDIYNAGSAVEKSSAPPVRSKYYGTGRVNARRAVQLALDWHNTVNPTQTVLKPRLVLADRMNPDGSILTSIAPGDANQVVDSPDIWVKPLTDNSVTVPTIAQPLNALDTAIDQKIYVRVRNQGNGKSFTECDLRVYIAFTDDVNPAFPFPAKWYDQSDVKLIKLVELPEIAAGAEHIASIEWKGIIAYWNSNNPLDPTTTKRKRAYLLVHIAPFDGPAADVQLNNVRNNKQLTCREIIVTHNGVNDRTAYLPGNRVDIEVADLVVEKSYDLIMENAGIALFDTIKIKATKKSRIDNSLETILYSKTGGVWSIESGNPAWITFDTPEETVAPYAGYKNAKFPHTIKVNQDQQEVKIEIVNA